MFSSRVLYLRCGELYSVPPRRIRPCSDFGSSAEGESMPKFLISTLYPIRQRPAGPYLCLATYMTRVCQKTWTFNRHRSSRNREKRARSGCASGMMYSRFFVAFLQVILILQKFGRQGTRHVPRRIPQYRVSYSWCCLHRRESPYTHKPASACRTVPPGGGGGGSGGGLPPPCKVLYCTRTHFLSDPWYEYGYYTAGKPELSFR